MRKAYSLGLALLVAAAAFAVTPAAEAKKTVLTQGDKRDWHVTADQDSDAPLRDYAILYDAGGTDGSVAVIGIPSMRTYRHIKCGVDMHNFPFSGSNAGNNNGSPDGKYLYVSDKGADTVLEVNLQTAWVERIFALPKPFGIHHSAAMSPNGKYIYCTGELTGRMLKMRLADGATTVLEIPPAPSAPDYPDTSKDGRYVFAGNYYHSAVMVFSQDPFKLIKEIPVGKNPHGTNVSPTNRMVAVCDKLSATLSIIDVEKLKVHKVIPTGAGPLHNQFDTLGKYVYQSCFVSDSTSKLDTQRMQLVDEFPIHYRVGHNSIAPDNAYYVSQNKFSTGLFTPTGIIFAVNFELQDIDETSPTYGKTVKLIPVDGEPHESRIMFSTYIQRWNSGKGEELFSKGYDLGDYHVSFDKGPGLNSKQRPQLEPIHVGNSSRQWIPRDDGKPGVTKEGDVYVVRVKGFSYGYVPRFIHVPKGAKVRMIFTNIDKAAGLTKNPDVTMGITAAGYYGPRTMLFGVRGMSVLGEFVADKAGEFEYYCQQFCGPLHLEMRGTLFVDPPGQQASQSVGDYDEISKQEQMLDPREHQWIVGTNKLRNKLNEGNEPVI